MDPTALRLEKVKLALGQAQDDAQFFGRLYVALAAVTVAAVFSVVGAAIAGQVPWGHAVLLEVLLLICAMALVHLMRRRAAGLRREYAMAFRHIDMLMLEEDEPDADESPPHEG